ncbi:sarcosine oxidase subunit alpha [Devosia enhydra]|uniref:Sarcosine oxidase subunit alpha n=1 Tax=Devosia enhydra TaxID=665118 RepID=A0A1K2I0G5_9HYPH|nr:FAD-dependent oxidoreductase [Devosia enhydra]SFZ85862.1 sarcosine oxidase subunit alpha [Devosia enhydra]
MSLSAASRRLDAGAGPLAGRTITRERSFTFRLDGQVIAALPGDTVLSAVLAHGIDSIGTYKGHPLALHERLSPSALPRRHREEVASALPLARMPAVEGADLVTLARPDSATAGLGQLRQRFSAARSLNFRLDAPGDFVEPWRDGEVRETLRADVIIVGGGVTGLTAALQLARNGVSVALFERRSVVGGDAGFYGAVEDEEPPDQLVARMANEAAALPGLSIHLCAEVVAVTDGAVRVHLCRPDTHGPRGVMAEAQARLVVLATGTLERLPVFSGNRLPGVSGAVTAYQRAAQFGLWSGSPTILATQSNAGYRLALMAGNAGVEIARIVDSRVNAQSRFIDFCKASGFTLAGGQMPRYAVPRSGGRGLSVGFAMQGEEAVQASGPFDCEGLVIAGSTQPDITLWCRAGGGAVWNARAGRLEGRGERAGLMMAGSAAGLRNTSACLAAGAAVAAAYLGHKLPLIDDTQIETVFETADDTNPLAPPSGEQAIPAFLDVGDTLLTRPVTRRPRLVDRLLRRRPPQWDPLVQGSALGLCDLVAAVHLGVIPRGGAGSLAAERCLAPASIATGPSPLPPPPQLTGLPPYLAGRFGPAPMLWTVLSDDSRFFEVGCLAFADAAETDPGKALGVIVAPAPGRRSGGLLLLGKPDAAPGERFSIRDENGAVPVRLIERFRTDSLRTGTLTAAESRPADKAQKTAPKP